MTETPSVTPPLPEASPSTYVNYWGTDQYEKFFLPDGVQYFEFKLMNEGEKSRFEKMTTSDVIVNQDRSARMRMDSAEQRHQLIKTSVTNWLLYAPDERQGGQMAPASFSKQLLEKWLSVADPKIVEDLEFAIRMANPWMQSEMSVEEIDKEIDRLTDVRKQVVEREAGEAASAIK